MISPLDESNTVARSQKYTLNARTFPYRCQKEQATQLFNE